MLYLGALLVARRRRRLREDAGLERRRRALARARRRLRRIGGATGPEPLWRCLREYLGDKLGLEGAALTAAEARQHLAEAGISEDAAARTGRLLERLEAAQYGPADLDARLSGEVAELIRALDREL